MPENSKILITGAAGLIGQNLVARLKDRFADRLVAIDKHHANVAIFNRLHGDVEMIEADLANPGDWEKSFEGVGLLVLNHAQIGALTEEPFILNNVTATKRVLAAAKKYKIPYIVHISSSVINSQADDFYTRTKGEQEKMVLASGIPCTVLRPTLMFGWFDRKHLGWLARFMKSTPVFPIPGHGKYLRQPLYAGDFCNVIISCIENPRPGKIFNISGQEKIDYIDLIRTVKKATGARTFIMKIPYGAFYALLKIFAFFNKNPPFTTSQLEALVIPEEFEIMDWPCEFNITSTSLLDAMKETHSDERYSKIGLEF